MMIEPDYYTSMKNILASPQKVAKNWLFVEINDELLELSYIRTTGSFT